MRKIIKLAALPAAIFALVILVATARGAAITGLVSPATSVSGPTSFYFVDVTTGTFQGVSSNIAQDGFGTFSTSAISGSGTFTIFHGGFSSANVSRHGTWHVTSMVGFTSFGGFGPRAEGGQLVVKAVWIFDNGQTITGVTVTVTCLLGAPPAGLHEGTTQVGPGILLSTPVAGVTIFTLPASIVPVDTAATFQAALANSRNSLGACHLGCC
jgi:hypothetical protein